MEGKKKIKYVQKPLFVQKIQQKQEETNAHQPIIEEKQKKVKYIEKGEQQTTVVNVKVEFLRKIGYKNLLDWLQNPNHIYIGRANHYVPGATGSIWANPFKVDKYGRDGCIQKFKQYLLADKKLLEQVKNLKGKVLGCWCAPERCHGHILAEIANSIK